jgi:ABC-type transport system involved in cytochrome bd biosynthesis fused ATPase/permease subunit
MVVGPTGGGKSSNVRTLQRALTMLKNNGEEGIKYEKVDIHHLNPKSITMGQLCDLRVLTYQSAFHAARVRLTMPWVVSLLLKRPFGPTS